MISGRVQGVAYRAWTQDQAKRLQLTGYVANRADGRVEVVACGEPEAIVLLLAKLYVGPPAAQVTLVEEQAAEVSTAVSFAVR